MDVLNLNKQKLTHIVIIIFILLSLTYLYNMNTNPSHTNPNPNPNSNPNTTKTITENFMVLTEDQELGSNNVMIDNLTQVNFVAGGNDNTTINFADPNTEWPVNLQQLFDSKLDNNGVVGGFVAGNSPLQGIVLNDKVGKSLVKIGDNITASTPITATTITDTWIQFGGPNASREANSAQISAGMHSPNTLCIVGMSTGTDGGTRKIAMWAEGGCNIYGQLNVTGKVILGDFGNTMPRSPNVYTRINETGIQFGGANNARQVDSAQITAGMHTANTLCIVGMSTGTDAGTRKIAMWAEGGCNIYGNLDVSGNGTFGGALNVSGNGTIGGSLSCNSNLKMSGSGNGGIGGAIQIVNTDKTGDTEAFAWNIYNMRNYGGADTSGPGKPGSGLSFWRYSQSGCGKGLCHRHMTLNDDGSTFIGADLTVGGKLTVGGFTCDGITLNTTGRMHISGGETLYLLNKTGVIVSNAWGGNGNLNVDGELYIGGVRAFAVRNNWHNKTGERTFNHKYWNNWNCAMMINITINFNTYNDVLGDGPHVILVVNGNSVQECYQFRHDQNYRIYSMSSIVGAGQEYYIHGASSQNFNQGVLRGWYEFY